MKIYTLYQQGWPVNAILRKLSADGIDISWGAVKNVIIKYQHGRAEYEHLSRKKLPTFKSITDADIDFVKSTLDENPTQTCSDIMRRLSDKSTITSKSTVRKMIDSAGYTASTPRYGQMIRILKSDFFVNTILRLGLLPFIRQTYPDHHRFQQDNDPKHRSNLNKRFMQENQINWWDIWPSESPDFNPIEKVWSMMKQRLNKKKLSTKNDLTSGIKDFWKNDLTVERCNTFIDHNFKVLPVAVFIGGRATGFTEKDIPREIKGEIIKLF
ncbi:unnamed protein product [Mytilus coruscus]|uniref:Tc1-like transposase DDE domain-containing protein n=1 Tax=Mytilus coruscus TaxID=42192 RepID=A0A6J8ETE6_MYTCO|nr:unnamed protein product [Mytilus coruscus]